MLFLRVDTEIRDGSADGEIAALRQERASLYPKTLPTWHMYQPDKERESGQAQNRINIIDGRLKELDAPVTDNELTVLEMVLCVNAPEKDRAKWEQTVRETAAEAVGVPPPVTLLMTPGGKLLHESAPEPSAGRRGKSARTGDTPYADATIDRP